METKVLEIENLKEQIFELQQENHLLVTKRIDSNREKDLQIARLKDRLEFASEQADTFAKSLKGTYEEIESIIEKYGVEINMYLKLEQLKNSIPESALKRAE